MSLVKNNPIANYEKWATVKLSTISKKHYEEVALLLIRLFRSAILLQLQEAKAFPVEFTKVIFCQLARFREIQSGLKANLSEQEIILHKKNVKLWLQTQRTFLSIAQPQQLWNQEVVSSYMILNFPFQETCLRKTCHATQVAYWENELIESEKLLYQYFDQNREEVFSDQEKLRLHRLLQFNCAVFEKGKKIGWLQVISDWVQSDEERKEKTDALLSALAAPFSLEFDFPAPRENERKQAKGSLSFHDYVIARTVRSAEKYFECPFSDNVRQILANGMVETLSIRHDLTFFSHHREALLAYNRQQKRCSDFFVRNLQLYAAYSPFLKIYSSENRQLFFDLIFLSQMENDHSQQLAQYLPQRLTNLSQITFDQAWSAIRPHVSRMDWSQESQLMYILGFFVENGIHNKDLLLSTLRPLEILKFYKKNQPTRNDRAAVYGHLSNEAPKASQIQENEHLAEESIEIFEREVRKISGDFTFDQKAFLFALFEEEKFEKYLRFLQNLCSAIKKPLPADLAFHFLMSDFETKKSTTANEEIFIPLNDALISIKEVLAKEKIDQEELIIQFGELFVQLSTVSRDFDQNTIRSEFQFFLFRIFRIDLND